MKEVLQLQLVKVWLAARDLPRGKDLWREAECEEQGRPGIEQGRSQTTDRHEQWKKPRTASQTTAHLDPSLLPMECYHC